MRTPNYDKSPMVTVPGFDSDAWRGWESIAQQLRNAMEGIRHRRAAPVLVVECYSGVFEDEVRRGLQRYFESALWIDARDAFLPADAIDSLVQPYLGDDDPIFGYLTSLSLESFFSSEKLSTLRARMGATHGPVVIVGVGASVVAPQSDVMVYADLPRWEAQGRQRRNEISNLGVENRTLRPPLKYKRSFFVDWRVCDRAKQGTMAHWDFLLDTTAPNDPKMVTGEALHKGLAFCATRPFRVVPFFDPGPWGGQWMKQVCGLDPQASNYAWCFDCVPEENSLLLQFGDVKIEVPAIDLVFAQPLPLLGAPVEVRFGAEFPIRFDFLDTMGGGNLSLQVHPLTSYIQRHFGVSYTQDESYYLLDAKPGAEVYLGRKRGADFDDMIRALDAAQSGGPPFDDAKFIARFPAKKHDHFLIPAGTLHCSGRDSMVLEISATPYIFTFKLWDWGRLGLDGRPRPINIGRGRANILWERDEDYVRTHLVNRINDMSRGEGWREERTGLHELQFIETRRHWFSGTACHDTGGERHGSVNVLNLVDGEEAIVESPEGAFEPFVAHYAETFIVPAAVGRYNVRPFGRAAGTKCATIKAFVRS